MNANKRYLMTKLKQKIKNGLKKDADALLESLSGQAADAAVVKTSIASVSELLAEEKNLTVERKKLSRQIGAARQQDQDPAELIAGVSEISKKLKLIDASIDKETAVIAASLASGAAGEAEADSTAAAALIPAHLAVTEMALDCNLTELQLAHSDSIDEAEWQGFVASKPHANMYLSLIHI